MNKAITIIIVLVVIIGGYLLIHKKSEAPVVPSDNSSDMSDMNTSGGTTTPPLTEPDEDKNLTSGVAIKDFTVTGSNFKFSPSTIVVKKGDTVRIKFVNSGGMHDWKLDEFGAQTKTINGGQTDEITFIADKVGSFEFYCSVGTHRQMGMKGTFTVTE